MTPEEAVQAFPEDSGPLDLRTAQPPAHPGPEERVTALTKGLYELLDRAVNEPWRWQVLLDNSATLWRYSGGNAALLMLQMAHRGKQPPTLVAGYKEWERHGRYVLKGEHALWVIAPRTARVTPADGDMGDEPISISAPEATKRKTHIVGWRGQAVFDVTQTEGKPLLVPRLETSPEDPWASDHQRIWDSLRKVAGGRGFAVELSESQHSLASGFTNFDTQGISVGSWLGGTERVAVLAHELGHLMLHGPNDKLGQLYGGSIGHRGLAEIEAESVAYTVLRAHGTDHGAQSASYLAGWADAVIGAEADSILRSDKDHKPLSRLAIAKSVLGRVTMAAKSILEITNPPATGGRFFEVSADPLLETIGPKSGRKLHGVDAQFPSV